MPEGIGYGFAPFLDEDERRRRQQNGGADPMVQEAIKILSLRMPTFSETAIVPQALTQGLGGPMSPVGPAPGGPPMPSGVPAPGTTLPPPDVEFGVPGGGGATPTNPNPQDPLLDDLLFERPRPGRLGGRTRFPA